MGNVKEAANLVNRQGLRQVTPLARRTQLGCWIDPYEAFRKRIFVQASDRCRGTGDRRGRCGTSGHLPRREPHRVILDVTRIHVSETDHAAFTQVAGITQRIAAVVGNSVSRRAFLDAKIVHPLVHGCFEGGHSDRVSEIPTNVRNPYARSHIFANM